jgi:hypothetical protein
VSLLPLLLLLLSSVLVATLHALRRAVLFLRKHTITILVHLAKYLRRIGLAATLQRHLREHLLLEQIEVRTGSTSNLSEKTNQAGMH